MSEGLKIALTVLAGVSVFVAGQIIQKWFIEPIIEQRQLTGKIIHAIVFHAATHQETSSEQEVSKARVALRDLASQALQSVVTIPCYSLLAKLHLVYKKGTMINVAIKLDNYANNLRQYGTLTPQQEIMKLLGLDYYLPYSSTTPYDNVGKMGPKIK